MNRITSHFRAFTLLEMLAVVTILGVIALVILPRVSGVSMNAKYKTCFYNRTQINMAVERYYIEKGVWPASDLSDIGADPTFFPDGIPTCPATGAAYRLNSTTHHIIGHTGLEGKAALDHN